MKSFVSQIFQLVENNSGTPKSEKKVKVLHLCFRLPPLPVWPWPTLESFCLLVDMLTPELTLATATLEPLATPVLSATLPAPSSLLPLPLPTEECMLDTTILPLPTPTSTPPLSPTLMSRSLPSPTSTRRSQPSPTLMSRSLPSPTSTRSTPLSPMCMLRSLLSPTSMSRSPPSPTSIRSPFPLLPLLPPLLPTMLPLLSPTLDTPSLLLLTPDTPSLPPLLPTTMLLPSLTPTTPLLPLPTLLELTPLAFPTMVNSFTISQDSRPQPLYLL